MSYSGKKPHVLSVIRYNYVNFLYITYFSRIVSFSKIKRSQFILFKTEKKVEKVLQL